MPSQNNYFHFQKPETATRQATNDPHNKVNKNDKNKSTNKSVDYKLKRQII